MVRGAAFTPGRANGEALKLAVPLSFWGGVDLNTGAIVDASHPCLGSSISGRVLIMPSARGSSSSSSALVELARAGIAPLAIIMKQFDPILVIGSIVASELYGVQIPLAAVNASDWALLRNGHTLSVVADDCVAQIDICP